MASAPPRRVLVVEDHQLLAQSLGAALSAEGLHVEIAHLSEDILQEAAASSPDVVLLDLDLGPERESGEGLLPGLLATGATVVVVSGSTDPLRLGTCLELGAAGVLSKSASFEDVLGAVLDAAEGRPIMRDEDRQALLTRMRRCRRESAVSAGPFRRLTPREQEVLRLLMQGLNAETIARQAVVSESTVRTQIRGVLTKLGVSSQLAAVAAAHRAGWESG